MGGWGKEKSAKKTKNSFYLPFIFSHFFFHASRVNSSNNSVVNQITNNYWYILSDSRSLPVVNFEVRHIQDTITSMSDHDEKMAASSSSPMSMPAQSPITEPNNHTTNNDNTAASPTQSQSASKRSRGRPRKYHTDAEREEAKRRYRENHKTKAASAGGVAGGANSANAALNAAAASFTPIQPAAKQQDVDELWEAVRALQGEVERLKAELMQRDAAAAAALPGQKRRKV